MKKLIIILTLITLPSVGYGYDTGSVGALLKACELYDDKGHLDKAIANTNHDEVAIHMLESGNCLGYFRGTRDTFDLINVTMDVSYPEAKLVCIPKEVTNQQIYKIFIKYANKHPEMWHERAGSAVAFSLLEVFRCRK